MELNIPPFIARMLHMRREQEKKTQESWRRDEAASDRRKQVVRATKELIKTSCQQYLNTVRDLKGKELENFTKYQSPRSVLSLDKRFQGLAELLRDQQTWNMLSRYEKRFIAAACKLAGIS